MKRKPTPILNIDRLGIQRDGHRILENVSWRVDPKQHWVMLGANGSGKTSLLSALTGYLTPSEGDIDLLGQRYGESDWRRLRPKIGLVSSAIRRRMHPAERALETIVSGKYAMIDFWGKPGAADRQAAGRVLKQMECAHLADRPWLYLSQGERQRILIGRALMAGPRLIILDEPCAGLDPVAREHFLQFLQRLAVKRRAPTLVLVTHHVEEIMPGFTHLLVLKAGTVLAAGPMAECLNSKCLSEAFEAAVNLEPYNGRYSLNVTPRTRGVL